MPVLLPVLPDPTDLVIQGEQLRAPAVAPAVVLVAGEQQTGMMANDIVQASQFLLHSNNAAIATPAGALIKVTPMECLIARFVQSTTRWLLSGVTYDLASAPLAGCRVVVFETGRIAQTGCPVVAETISDGSGNYSVEVPLNTAYQAIAYLPGSPDVAGITRNDIVPIAA